MARPPSVPDDGRGHERHRVAVPVGDLGRHRAEVAIAGSLLTTAAYSAFTIGTKELPFLYLHQPWQDDPYDALVSFDVVVLPLLLLISVLRAQLCRRDEALPVRRLTDLLQMCRLATVLTMVTQAAEWISVAGRSHRASWNAATSWQVAALAALSAATGCVLVTVHRVRRDIACRFGADPQPDWLGDAVTLSLALAERCGPASGLAGQGVRWFDRQVVGRVRAHPGAAALVAAGVLSLPETAAKSVLEQYPAPLVALVYAVSTASLFAFFVVAGSCLRLVAPSRPQMSTPACGFVAACVAGPSALAFRGTVLRIVRVDANRLTVGGLATLVIGAAVIAAALSVTAQTALRHANGGSHAA